MTLNNSRLMEMCLDKLKVNGKMRNDHETAKGDIYAF